MTIFREIWGGVGAKVRIVALVRRAAVAHRRFRKNGRLGNLTVPAGAGGELPLRRALAQNSPSASASPPTIVWATMRCAAPSRLPLHSAWRASRGRLSAHSDAARRTPARLRADVSEPSTGSNVHSGGREGGWIIAARTNVRTTGFSYFSCAQRAWQSQLTRWSLTRPVACMNA